jgi:glutaconyl-CoA/methylmalonyl-CoA decarboxylase subunit gamma
MKRLRVTVEGKVYEVLVETLGEAGTNSNAHVPPAATPPAPVARVAPPPVAPAGPPASAPKAAAGAKDIISPLAGKVVSIDVQPGQAVDEGTQVATLEAMKMNTYVYAPHAGRVAAIVANPGDGVDEGAVLVRLG